MPAAENFCHRLSSLRQPVALLSCGLWLLAAVIGCTPFVSQTGRPPTIPRQCDPAADAAMLAGDVETGLRLHREFAARHPENPLAQYHLGYALGLSGDAEGEIAHYEKAIALGYNANAQLYFNLAMAYLEQNHVDRAMAGFENAIELDPNAVDAMLELARLKRQAGDREAARHLLEQAEELEPQNDLIRRWLRELEAEP